MKWHNAYEHLRPAENDPGFSPIKRRLDEMRVRCEEMRERAVVEHGAPWNVHVWMTPAVQEGTNWVMRLYTPGPCIYCGKIGWLEKCAEHPLPPVDD